MKSILKHGAMVTAMLAAAGCTTMGAGTGMSRGGGGPTATFTWRSQGSIQGDMTATLSDGRVYHGRFFQITRQTTVDDLGPLWAGWGGRYRWHGWDYWGPEDETITHYSGHVLANLQGPDGYMRCQFQLALPSSGMNQGGVGHCQLPGGAQIDADFGPGHG